VLHGSAGEDIAVRMFNFGNADASFGDVGREGYCVRDRLAEDATDEQVDEPDDIAERNEDCDEDLLKARREKIEDV
jgi:hypothetical protein